MDPLKQKFSEKASTLRTRVKAMLREEGNRKVGEVTLKQVFGGARGIKTMVYETSQLDAQEGIRFRGYSIPELREKLPKAAGGGKEPLPEGLFWLMLTGDLPTEEDVRWLSQEWQRRANVPDTTYAALDALSPDTHPMIQFNVAISSMASESIFQSRYAEGMPKSEYWDPVYEDAMNLIARLPHVAAYIFRRSFFNGNHLPSDNSLDWAANYANLLGYDNPEFTALMRLYLTIHADHEGGNASAHTVQLVGSTLADPYLSFAAGMGSLAGPLHGLANQEVIKFINDMLESLGTQQPSKEQIADYVQQTLDSGRVIPGYGHAVLRQPDPRFIAQRDFAKEYIPDADLVQVVWKLFDVVPGILDALGKVKNPWPNVDAHSGALLVHYGFDQYNYYTVLFGVSRALGTLAGLCWSRALGLPLERPKSVTTDWVFEWLEEQKEAVG